MTAARRTFVERLADRALGARRLAVDGPDAAGKTTLADELAEAFERREVAVVRISIDDFLRAPEERHRRGRESPDGYFLDSFDLGAFRGAVLSAGAVAIADGVFLLRDDLVDLWDFTVFLEVGEDEIIRRAVARDGPRLGGDVEIRYRRRYLPAQRAYRAASRPAERADVVVDNTDPASPLLCRG